MKPAHHTSRRIGGFSLLEIGLIVVVLGILAATVRPQMAF